jgi:glycosyltransferase involved in cell wall biosynthesis
VPAPIESVTFATDSTLGLYGLGGPASHIARALVQAFPSARILASGDAHSGLSANSISIRPQPIRNRVAGLHWRLRRLAENAEDARIAFDAWASRHLPESEVVVAENTTALATLSTAMKRRSRTVLMYYNRSFRSLLEEVEEERRIWGGPPTFLTSRLVERAEEECRIAGVMVGMSSLVLEDLGRTGVEPARLRRAHYGVDSDRFRPAPRPHGEFVVAFVGWLAPWKGYPYLVEAFRRASIPGSRLLLHGGTDEAFHHELVHRLKGDSDVRVVRGPVEETYRQASVVVLPSVSDAYGLVGLEAMASGVPLIVTDRCGVAEDVRDGINGFVIPARDPDTLRERLLEVNGRPDLAIAMGVEGRKVALARPWSRFAHEVLDAIRDAR